MLQLKGRHTGNVLIIAVILYLSFTASAIITRASESSSEKLDYTIYSHPEHEKNKVLLIGIDGILPAALEKANTPNIDKLIADGCYTNKSQAAEITVSGPCWSAILTGTWTEKHNAVDNKFEDTHYDKYPHFFARVKQEKPELFTAHITDWQPLDDKILGDTKVDYRFFHDYEDDGDALSIEAAVDVLSRQDPDLMFLYIGDGDIAGHDYGFHTSAIEYIAEIEQIDGQIGQVIRALKNRSTYASENWLILVTTDHGGSLDGSHGRNEPLHRNVFFIASGHSARKGTLYENVSLVDIPVTAMAHLGIKANPEWQLDGHPVGIIELNKTTQIGKNLIFNGDAEYSTGYPNTETNASVPGWADTGGMTIITYTAPEGFPNVASPGPMVRGNNFFCGGKTGYSEISQIIDVSENHMLIDTNSLACQLSGYFGGYQDQTDQASLTAQFLDENDHILNSITIGPVTVYDRKAEIGSSNIESLTGLLERNYEGPVPANTRRIKVILLAEMGEGDNDGYADNLSLKLFMQTSNTKFKYPTR